MFLERTTLTPLRGPRGGTTSGSVIQGDTLVCVEGADLEGLFSVCTQRFKVLSEEILF